MGIQITNALPDDTWRDFVESHPNGNVFHTPEMFQVFSRVRNHKAELWAALRGSGDVLALLLPIQITLDQKFHRITTRAVSYGSVLYQPGIEGKAALQLLLQAYKRSVNHDYLFTELRNVSDLHDVQPLLESERFVYQDHLNYLIDLDRPPEAVLQSIGSRTRKQIRRAIRKNDVLIDEIRTANELAPYLQLISRTYKAAQVPLAHESLFHAAFDVLSKKGMMRLTTASVDHNPAAVSVELLYKSTMYGWYSGLDRTYSSYVPNELLMWSVLKWGAERGYKVYDFGGAGKPNETYGVRDFKAKFGGELVAFGRNTCFHLPLLTRLSTMGYQVYRRCFL